MPLLLGHDELVGQVVGQGLDTIFVPPFVGIGIVQDDRLIGGYILNDYNGSNIELTAYAPRLMRLGHMRFLAKYIFGQLQCRRISARTSRSNKITQRTLLRSGFKWEGVLRDFYPQGDAILYRLSRDDCKWFKP